MPVGFVNVVESKERLFAVCSNVYRPSWRWAARAATTSLRPSATPLIYSAAEMLDPSARGWKVSDKFWRSAMNPTRKTDEAFTGCFPRLTPFQEHLTKREGSKRRAINTTTTRSAIPASPRRTSSGPRWLIRKSGETPSSNWKDTSLAMHSAWSAKRPLTMVLPPETRHPRLENEPGRLDQGPDADQLEQHELKYYGPLYGDDFTVRNNRNLREQLTYLGAYLGGKLVGDCYIFASDGYVCMDGLLVDEDFRHQYIAMTLMKHIAERRRSAERSCIFTLTPRIHRRNCMRRWDFRPLTSSMNISAPISRN